MAAFLLLYPGFSLVKSASWNVFFHIHQKFILTCLKLLHQDDTDHCQLFAALGVTVYV